MTNSNRPKWLDVAKLTKIAGKEMAQQSALNINLPVHSHKVIAAYICPQCRLQYTSSDVEKQVKKAARTGTQYIECPKCASPLREGCTAIVRDLTSIVNRAERYVDSNTSPSRSIDTWVDKAIYGRIVQKLGEHIQQFGIDNPQLKFQRGIRAHKFPGQPMTAKGAEFTVEFIDFNNTRNRIIIQAGITIKGELIVPRTFKTLSGSEYPLTKQAIDDLTSGKVYDRVVSDATIRPLTYRYPDPVRFREISAGNSKMQKTAMDPAAMDEQIQGMGVTDPTDIQAMKDVLTKYQGTPAGSTPIGAPPAAAPAQNAGGAFMNGVGLSSKLNMKKKSSWSIWDDPSRYTPEMHAVEALYAAVEKGVSFLDAYHAVQTATKGIVSIGQEEFQTMRQVVSGRLDISVINSLMNVPDDSGSESPSSNPDDLDTPNNWDWDTFKPANRLNMKKEAEFTTRDQLRDYVEQVGDEGMQESDPIDYSWEQIGQEALYASVVDGLSFPETYDAVRTATQGNALITQAEFETMGQIVTGDTDQPELMADRAAELIKQAEVDTVKHLHKTAEMVQDEFSFDDMNSSETTQWIATYADTYNKSLDNGDGLVEASRTAHKTAADALSKARIKLALRDKDTLVPLIETDPDYSIATTDEFEAEFGGKYEDTDGGILPMEDREYTTMFKGSAVEKKAAYELTIDGQNALAQLAGGQQIVGPNSDVLQTVLRWMYDNPTASLDTMTASYGYGAGSNEQSLRDAVQFAITAGYVNITPDTGTPQEGAPPTPETFADNTDKIEKAAESTGVDLDADEVGQNPMNYSRLKGQVQDYLRSGNIPPSKVDMHKLKDGGYSLEELRSLIDSFKVNKDSFFPTAHAEVSAEQLQKQAEEKLSDLIKQMPVKKEIIVPPVDKAVDNQEE